MGNMSLLISEPPLMVLPELAKQIGLNEAIVLQQVHYWLSKSDKVQDGHKWVYNSYEDWHKQFPFWGIATVKRAFTSLEKQGYLISANYNKAGFDKTKWYRIDYEKLAETESVIQRRDQIDPMEQIKMIQPIPETIQRLLQRITKRILQRRITIIGTSPMIYAKACCVNHSSGCGPCIQPSEGRRLLLRTTKLGDASPSRILRLSWPKSCKPTRLI